MKHILKPLTVIIFIVVLSAQNSDAQYSRTYRRSNYYPLVSLNVYETPYRYSYGGYDYHYRGGSFYRSIGGVLSIVAPPIGLHINFLPPGYRRLYGGMYNDYYYNGIYYRRYNDMDYEVINAPMGAVIDELPAGARRVIINDEKFYEFDGTYYKEEIRNGYPVYKVTGKRGRLNTGNSESSQRVGDIVNRLPDGSKPVNIKGEKYYLSPDNTYYQQIIDNDQVSYKIVGKEEDENNLRR